MTLFQQWQSRMEENQNSGTYRDYFRLYLAQETEAYREILDTEQKQISGVLKELADHYHMEPVTFIGFLDGINTSLVQETTLDELTEDSLIDVTIDYEKLYYNMLKVKADWLYNLPQWESLLSVDKKKEIRLKLHEDSHVTVEKTGRNDPCPCGSGKKYKKCCGQ
ncbi:MAG: SEC-C domain-containing protein [Thermoclostridium sp.]|nr:SEC-C domain-containing protein [Thermoclostridium sp.]